MICNPVKWFTRRHPVRVADRVLNDHFGGTYTAYLRLEADPDATLTCREIADSIRGKARERYRAIMPEAMMRFIAEVDHLESKLCNMETCAPAMAISRNAITISMGFTPLLIAPLVPYRTVGFFLATIMAVSWMTTLLVLPALLAVLQRWAFREPRAETIPATDNANTINNDN